MFIIAPKNYEKWQSSGWEWKTSFGSKHETSPYCKSSCTPHCVVLFLIPIHLLILLPNSCIVVSRVSFIVSSLGTPHWETHCWRLSLYVKRCSLWLYFFIQTIFRLFHCIIKWSRGGARDVDSPIRMYRYVFKKISWNIEIHSEVLLSYKSFVTSSDA